MGLTCARGGVDQSSVVLARASPMIRWLVRRTFSINGNTTPGVVVAAVVVAETFMLRVAEDVVVCCLPEETGCRSSVCVPRAVIARVRKFLRVSVIVQCAVSWVLKFEPRRSTDASAASESGIAVSSGTFTRLPSERIARKALWTLHA